MKNHKIILVAVVLIIISGDISEIEAKSNDELLQMLASGRK